jgi:DMSO/TMAO reductase YedYZ heme-binding membrane subunit
VSAIELSNDVGLAACYLLTLNLLLGLLLGLRYNPWKHWPHRRFNYFKVHNWTGYVALAVSALHPVIVLFSTTAHFRLFDILVPVESPKQPLVNTVGALGLYALALVVATSYYRNRMRRRTWKRLHYTAYAAALAFFAHGLLSDPTIKGEPVDWLDAEKVSVEVCVLLVAAATVWRVRWALRRSAKTIGPAHAVAGPIASRSREVANR